MMDWSLFSPVSTRGVSRSECLRVGSGVNLMEVRGLILRAAFSGPATATASMYLQVAPQRPRLLVTTSTRRPTVSVCSRDT